MVATDDLDPQVILVVGEADLVSDFQQHFAARGLTVRFAEDPGAARAAVSEQRPRLVVIPVDGACKLLLEAWEEGGGAPADVVIGLVESLSDADAVPKSVTRTARKGQPRETVSLAELLLRSTPVPEAKPEPEPEPESIWDKPGGILKNLNPEQLKVEDDEDEEQFGADPSRVSDIRSLGIAVRMAKATKAYSEPESSSSADLSLKLSRSGEDGDGGGEPEKPAGITDAMALLPQARAAETEEETIVRLSAERAAETPLGPLEARDPTAAMKVYETKVVVRKSRKGLILVVTAVLVLVGGGVAAYLLLRPKPTPRPKVGAGGPSAAQSGKNAKPERTKRGVYEDHFAGTIAQLPKTVTALDLDVSDEFLNRSVPELDPYMELALKRLSRSKRRKTLMERGTKLLGWERYPEARRFLKQAVDLKDGPVARAALSRAYEGLGRYWAAIVHLRRATKRDRKNAGYQARLGLLYLREDKKKPGCKALRRAVKLNKKHEGLVAKHCGKGKKKKRRRRRRRRR